MNHGDGSSMFAESRGRKLLFVVSTLACAVVLIAWAWSYLPAQVHAYAMQGRLAVIGIESSDMEYTGDVVDKGPRQAWDYLTANADSTHGLLGFSLTSGQYRMKASGEVEPFFLLGIPFWFLFLIMALGPAWGVTRTRRRRIRAARGLCVQCGYDLRATPGRCPECGAMPDAHSQSTPSNPQPATDK